MRAAAALLCVALAQVVAPPRDGASVAPKSGTAVRSPPRTAIADRELFPEDRAAWIENGSGIRNTGREKSGDYRFIGVRAGRYRVVAVERSRLNRSYVDPAGFLESVFAETTAITVTENEQRIVDLVLKKTAGY